MKKIERFLDVGAAFLIATGLALIVANSLGIITK
jgi:hypothetical protein